MEKELISFTTLEGFSSATSFHKKQYFLKESRKSHLKSKQFFSKLKILSNFFLPKQFKLKLLKFYPINF